jgi:hypothetical protein
MDYRVAEFVRFVQKSELLEDLVDEAKAATWTKNCEHAILVVAGTTGQEKELRSKQ